MWIWILRGYHILKLNFVLYNNTCDVLLIDIYIEQWKFGGADLDIVRNHLMGRIQMEVIFKFLALRCGGYFIE
jgi:hypothetical protein